MTHLYLAQENKSRTIRVTHVFAMSHKDHESALKVSTEVGSRLCGSKAAMTSDRMVSDLMLPLWEEVLWLFLDAWDSVRLRTTSTQWNVPRRYGPYGELFCFFFLKKEPMVLRELVRLRPSIRLHGNLLFLLMQKKPTFAPDSEAFNSYIGDGFQVPELKGGSEASEDEQADSSSGNNLGNGALFVIGLHRSGGAIAHFLQDWEVAKVALSCHVALDMRCQELYEVERRRDWFGF